MCTRMWIGLLAAALLAQAPPKRRVAVFDFENAAATGGIVSPFFSTARPNLG